MDDLRTASGLGIPPMLITTGMLRQQLEWVGRRFRFVPLDELADRLERGEPSAWLAAVTFDDGYRDVYECAFPMLRRMGIPSAVFVVTDFTGTTRLPLHDHLYLLLSAAFRHARIHDRAIDPLIHEIGLPSQPSRAAWTPFAATRALLSSRSSAEIRHIITLLETELPLGYSVRQSFQSLTWPMMRILQQGGMTIGSHTRSHILLTHEAPGRVDEEVGESRRIIERRLGTPVRHFAYPDGMFNGPTVRAVARAGYRCAFTSCTHRNVEHPLLTIPRLLLWEGSCRNALGTFSPAILHCHVSGMFRRKNACRPATHGEPSVSGVPGVGDHRSAAGRPGGSALDAPPTVSRRRSSATRRSSEKA